MEPHGLPASHEVGRPISIVPVADVGGLDAGAELVPRKPCVDIAGQSVPNGFTADVAASLHCTAVVREKRFPFVRRRYRRLELG